MRWLVGRKGAEKPALAEDAWIVSIGEDIEPRENEIVLVPEAELADVRAALEGAIDFIETVERWKGQDPDEIHEVLSAARAAVGRAGPS